MTERPVATVLWSWMAAAVALALPLTGLGGWLLWLFFPAFLPAVLLLWGGVFLLFLGVYLPLKRRSMSFSLEPELVTVTSGVLLTTTRRMQVKAVRQVTLLQGPLERRFHTAFLLISATGGYLLVEGLRRDRAEEWCQRLRPQ